LKKRSVYVGNGRGGCRSVRRRAVRTEAATMRGMQARPARLSERPSGRMRSMTVDQTMGATRVMSTVM